tara:strand:+ start:99 stop:398 length:300 start_codon:yes stop_codon:yes gene_type:complete
MSKNTHLSVRGVKPTLTNDGVYFDGLRGIKTKWPFVSTLIRGVAPTKCAASYWDFLPGELQALCYETNHKRAMREVLEQSGSFEDGVLAFGDHVGAVIF